MDQYANFTLIEEFYLLGFPRLTPAYYAAVGTLFLLIYLVLAWGNILTVVFVCYEKNLRKPTYLIFCNLAIVEFGFGTITMPKMIAKYLLNDETVTYLGCFVQMFFYPLFWGCHFFHFAINVH